MLARFCIFSFKDIAHYFLGCLLGSILFVSLNWYQISTQAYWYHLSKRYIPYVKHMMAGHKPAWSIGANELYVKHFFAKQGGENFLLSSSRGFEFDASLLGLNKLSILSCNSGISGFKNMLWLLEIILRNKDSKRVFIIADPWFFFINMDFYHANALGLGKKARHLLSRAFFLEWLRDYLGYIYLNGLEYYYEPNGGVGYSPKGEAGSPFSAAMADEQSRFTVCGEIVEGYRAVIKKLLDKGISVTFIKLPFHPESYKIAKVRQNFQALDKFTDDFAKSSGCQVIGTSFPTENLIAQDFYD
ncbi:MAG: hypothetical protein LBI30_00885, partial [Holosporales bacterium]|nr:hypothetical protein [Holosporales bacterium]